MAVNGEVFLAARQSLTSRNTELPFDQILLSNHFSDRVLNLKSRIHFHEIEGICPQPFRGISNKLNRARAAILDRFCRSDGRRPHCGTHIFRHVGRRGFFHNFLMAALQ